MNLLLLGVNEAMLSLLQTMAHSDRFRVLGWYQSLDSQEQLRALFPAGRRINDEEEFSRTSVNSVVVVAGGGDDAIREGLLRDLARDSVPLVLLQPACSAIMSVELDMIQRDTNAPMIPIHLDAMQPGIAYLASVARNSESSIGRLQQIVMERATDDRSDEQVRATLARDALLLRELVGGFDKVGAMQAGDDKSLANLSVHLTGTSGVIARWSVGPVSDFHGATLALVGDQGRMTLRMPKDATWELESSGNPQIASLDDVELQTDTSTALIHQIERGLDGEPIRPTWEDAFRCTDLADVASESIRRGKTLSVSNARVTEEDTFKSMMAAGGCLIILVLPFLLLFVSLIDGMKIPFSKTSRIDVAKNQRRVNMPADLSALKEVRHASSGAELTMLTDKELFSRYGIRDVGTPEAFTLSQTDITLAPAPSDPLQLEVDYEGSFQIWRGWPFLLLTPIALFLILQLFKLAFPKPTPATTS